MSTEKNKGIVRRYYDELNRKSFAVYDELVATDVTYEGVAVGRGRLRQLSTMLRTAFPDLRMTAEEVVAEGDLVATYFAWGGTHRAELQSPAMGRVAPTARHSRAKEWTCIASATGRSWSCARVWTG